MTAGDNDTMHHRSWQSASGKRTRAYPALDPRVRRGLDSATL